jgi:hypothetical protein
MKYKLEKVVRRNDDTVVDHGAAVKVYARLGLRIDLTGSPMLYTQAVVCSASRKEYTFISLYTIEYCWLICHIATALSKAARQ